jgi:hypothetical protein
MCGDTMRQSNFYEFAKLLNYDFQGYSVPVGHRVHQHGVQLDKNRLAPLYSSEGKIGTIKGLLPLYNILLRMFRRTSLPQEVIGMLFVLPLLSSCSFLTVAL